MVDLHLQEILDLLHTKKPLSIEAKESRIERLFKKPAKYLVWCSVLSFVALGLLAASVWLFDLSTKNLANAALMLFIGSAGGAILWMIADLLPALIGIFFYKDDFHRTRKLTIVHDLHQAKDLHRFDISVLRLADQWLSLRIERMRLHLGVLVGGTDKVAVLALILGAWGIWTNFPAGAMTLERYGYMMVSAFIGGLGLGGLLANIVIKELSYRRDLLSLALSTVPTND